MKKRITLLLCIVLLTGCGAKTEPEEVLESKTLTTKDVELLKKHGLDVTESNEVKVDKDGNMIFTVDEKEVKVPFTLLDDKEADKKLTETLKEQKEVSKKDTDPKKIQKRHQKGFEKRIKNRGF
ncbi:hypothetical protein MX850_06595 [Erysipelothrix sp. Poltava]|nr:hypothetical protein MX850_06595 [Erysipelothrix sp. Poltava]